jgi:hypothetical protein
MSKTAIEKCIEWADLTAEGDETEIVEQARLQFIALMKCLKACRQQSDIDVFAHAIAAEIEATNVGL